MMESVLMEAAPPESGSSFTALLELPANQAMELLHQPESGDSPAVKDQLGLGYGSNCSDAFLSSTDLVQRTAMFSMISTPEDMSESSFIPSNSSENSLKLKKEEQTISDSPPISSPLNSEPAVSNGRRRATKRKEQEKKEVKVSASKRSKSVESGKAREQSKDGEKLPFVHVRARRGQATDSHSLAERARREKINARMKLLQEIVPGCSKISGTALVLDEIINHVQSLQRQVEFLSMRLAAVNPRIDFNLDSILAEENGVLTPMYPITVTHEASSWPEVIVNHVTEGQQYHNQNQPQDQNQLWNLGGLQQAAWERNNNQNVVGSPENSVFSYRSANSVPLPLNQLKMEI